MDITRESEKILCCLYKIYLERRKNGISKATAREFENSVLQEDKHLSKIDHETISECLSELKDNGYLWINIWDDFKIEDKSIIYMENRFKNGLDEVVDALSKLIPLVPFV